jgi:hypothetical protein
LGNEMVGSAANRSAKRRNVFLSMECPHPGKWKRR